MNVAVQNSALCHALRRLWLILLTWARESALCRWYARAARLMENAVQGFFLTRLILHRGGSGRAWEESGLLSALTALADSIPRLLRALYGRARRVLDGSAAFRLLCALGENIPAILSWLLFALVAVPNTYWNNLYSLAIALACTALLFAAAARRKDLRLDVGRFGPYLWGFFFMLCVAVLESGSRRVSLRYWFYYVTAILLALLVFSTVDSLDKLKRLAAFGCAGVPLTFLYALYQRFFLRIENPYYYVDVMTNGEDIPGRVASYFENPNTYAQLLVLMIGVALGLLFASRTPLGRLASLAALGSGLVAIIMTYSRASWVGLAVALCLFVVFAVPGLIPAAVCLVLVMLPFLPSSIFTRFLTIFNPTDASTSSRFPIYSAGVRVWMTSPVTGTGLGSEVSAALAHNSDWYLLPYKFPHYHNIYIQLAVETGLLGLLGYAIGFLRSGRDSLRAVLAPSSDRGLRCLIVGCFSGMAGLMVSGIADFFWQYPRVMTVFWLVFGMMLCGVHLARTRDGQMAR